MQVMTPQQASDGSGEVLVVVHHVDQIVEVHTSPLSSTGTSRVARTPSAVAPIETPPPWACAMVRAMISPKPIPLCDRLPSPTSFSTQNRTEPSTCDQPNVTR